MPDFLLVVFGAVLGLIFGSFGTVVAYRVPRGESIASGRSKCPNCGHTITAVENIPLFSYLILGGKCRHCGARISPRYPFIEAVTAILFALAFAKFDFTVEAFVYSFFFWALVVLSVIDLEFKRLPDVITGPALAVGWAGLLVACIVHGSYGSLTPLAIICGVGLVLMAVLSFDLRPGRARASHVEMEADTTAVPDTAPSADASGQAAIAHPTGEAPASAQAPAAVADPSSPGQASSRPAPSKPATRRPTIGLNPIGAVLLAAWFVLFLATFFEGDRFLLSGAAIGATVFGGFFFAMVVLYQKGMGLGDAKLGFLLGTFCGFLGSPDLVAAGLFFAFLLGGLGGVVVLLTGGNRKTPVPFGPYLALGATVSIFAGQWVVDGYQNLLGG